MKRKKLKRKTRKKTHFQTVRGELHQARVEKSEPNLAGC